MGINLFNRKILLAWKANLDIQIFLEPYGCASYEFNFALRVRRMNKYRASTGCSQTIRVDVVVRIETFKSKSVLSFQVSFLKTENRRFK